MDRGEHTAYVLRIATITLVLLLGANLWLYIERSRHIIPFDGDIGNVRYVISQLADGISELTEKHSRLQNEMGRLADHLVTNSIESDSEEEHKSVVHNKLNSRVNNYDRQVRDFALESAGARILDTGSTVEYQLYDSQITRLLYSLTAILCSGCNAARAMIQPDSLPGECWAFQGSRGEAVIQLLGNVNITGVTLEHISEEIAPTGDISSAPRHFQLEGLDVLKTKRGHDFGKFEYNRNGRPIQYFDVVRPSLMNFHLVRVKILSNWGHPEYTCVYRVRVHGELAPGQGYIIGDKGDVGFDL